MGGRRPPRDALAGAMSAAQPPGVTAYVGAGGGGDTAAAVVRSLAHPAGGRAAVYGAGYSAAEYARSLAGGVRAPPGSGREYDRLPFIGDSALIDHYLRDTGARDHAGRDVPVFQLRPDGGSRHVAALFEGLRAADASNAAVIEQGAGFKHMSLLDECYVAAQLAPPHPVHIFASVRDLRDPAAARSAFEALAAHLRAADARRVVLIDFGADVLDFATAAGARRPLARDTTVLLMLLRMLRTGVIAQLRLEVYGPGVDAHDTLDAVMHRLRGLGGLARVLPRGAGDPEADAFVAALRQHAAPLARCGLLRRGRATANFLRAYEHELASAADVAAFVSEWLEARDDFARRSDAERAAFRGATRRYLEGGPARAQHFRAVVLAQLHSAEDAAAFVHAVCAPEYAQLVAALEAGC